MDSEKLSKAHCSLRSKDVEPWIEGEDDGRSVSDWVLNFVTKVQYCYF